MEVSSTDDVRVEINQSIDDRSYENFNRLVHRAHSEGHSIRPCNIWESLMSKGLTEPYVTCLLRYMHQWTEEERESCVWMSLYSNGCPNNPYSKALIRVLGLERYMLRINRYISRNINEMLEQEDAEST